LDYFKLWHTIDSTNLILTEKILAKHGYPGKSLVGEPTNKSVWYVIQHSDKIGKYLDMMKEASNNGELSNRMVATMEDRYLMQQGKEQIYGTQGMTYETGKEFIWPIKDPENVNQRRKEMGYDSTIEEYAQALYGDAFVYMVLTLNDVDRLKKEASVNGVRTNH